MKIKRMIFADLGCICLGIGCVGIALPIIPTVPFFLATVFFFANSSQKLHEWFLGTKMYKKHLESFVQKKGMLMQTKLTILTTVTLLMGFGFFMMLCKGILIRCAGRWRDDRRRVGRRSDMFQYGGISNCQGAERETTQSSGRASASRKESDSCDLLRRTVGTRIRQSTRMQPE